MTTTDYSALDRPEISMNSFYPRRNWTSTPAGAQDFAIPVAEDISLSCRFFPVANTQPTILFFYGNGETAADYDNIAPIYNQVGVNFFVADYRGYGQSGGLPSFGTMLDDGHVVRDELVKALSSGGYAGDLFVMGRSMGRHAAFELATNSPEGELKGVIIESGRPILGNFCYGVEPAVAEQLEAGYRAKVASIVLPALVIHGEEDTLAPVEQAREMYKSFASEQKRILTIPGAGHNDLLYRGINEYFTAIREFVGV
ncbi:Protein ABHD13 [Geodia barretti]|uniref:Protein ABHD13 n=1 Tax=Geodia barretti TaxID=519541 RepID=A0AA35TPA0_GEOBA|nr:Protein ABHD13 [Geodia barretti]